MPDHRSVFYAGLLILSGILSAFVSGIIWRRRSATGALPILVFLLSTMFWSLTYALYWLASSPVAKLFWLKTTYVGVVIAPAALLVFALQFIRAQYWVSSWRVSLLAIEPAITLILLWTDPLHGLFFGGKLSPTQSKIYDGGLWFWVNAAYTYGLVLICILILFIAVLRSKKLYRRQAGLVLIGGLFPAIGSVIGFTALNPFPTLDPTPFTFTLTGTFFALSLLRYRLLDLIPIGRDVLLEIMNEGMLLLDPQRRILDLNPAAQEHFDLAADKVIGKEIYEVLSAYPQVARLVAEGQEGASELALDTDPPRYLHIQILPVSDRVHLLSGTLAIFRDITDRKIAEQNLRAQLKQIEDLQISLQEQAIRDPLTGLFNRRYLQETLPRELSRAAREAKPLSLVMLDIDNFKEINDTCGHLAGDEILQRLSQALLNLTREGDIAARYGGDELLVVLAATPLQIACQRAEGWLKFFREIDLDYEGRHLTISFSAGVAAFPEHGSDTDQLIRSVDAALYRAKAAGRDNIVLATSG